MNLPTERIRDLCTSEVFDRAINYREDDRIEHVDRFDETITAAVQGSQPDPYDVEIEIEWDGTEPEEIVASCTCPYDWGGYCKHIIAVLLELSEKETDLEDEREIVERVLSEAHAEELCEFLLEECERDAELRRRLLVRFEAQDTQSVYDYKKEMSQQYRGPYTFQYEGPSFSEHHDLAERHREQETPLAAATIYRTMTEVRIENMDMVQDYYADDFEEELDAFVECLHEAELSHEDKREYIEYLFERWTSDDAMVGTFSGQYEDALWEFCLDDADLRYWRELLEAELPDDVPERGGIGESRDLAEFTAHYEATRRLETYADLLDALGDTDALRHVYERYYLDIRSFCLPYARLLAEEGDTDRAIEIAEKGLDTFSQTADIRRFLIETYADRDPEQHKAHLRELFSQTGDWEYYEELRALCSDDEWTDVVADLEAEFGGSNVHRLIQLYVREDRTAEAFETVIETARGDLDDTLRRQMSDNGLAILSEYRTDVAEHDPETYYQMYEELLEPFLAETTGRKHYRTVIDYLEEMRELGFEEEFEAFVTHLKDKHSNRPAFLDEMEALENA
jgi:hypothetical protein